MSVDALLHTPGQAEPHSPRPPEPESQASTFHPCLLLSPRSARPERALSWTGGIANTGRLHKSRPAFTLELRSVST